MKTTRVVLLNYQLTRELLFNLDIRSTYLQKKRRKMSDSNLLTFAVKLPEARRAQHSGTSDTELLYLADEDHPPKKKHWDWLLSLICNITKTRCNSDQQRDEENLKAKNRHFKFLIIVSIFLGLLAVGSCIALSCLLIYVSNETGYALTVIKDIEDNNLKWSKEKNSLKYEKWDEGENIQEGNWDVDDNDEGFQSYHTFTDQNEVLPDKESSDIDYHPRMKKQGNENGNLDSITNDDYHHDNEKDSLDYSNYPHQYNVDDYHQKNENKVSDYSEEPSVYADSRNFYDYQMIGNQENEDRNSDNSEYFPQYDDFLKMTNQEKEETSAFHNDSSQEDNIDYEYLPKYPMGSDEDESKPVETYSDTHSKTGGNGDDDYQNYGFDTERNEILPYYDPQYNYTDDQNNPSETNDYKYEDGAMENKTDIYNLYSDYIDNLGFNDDKTDVPITNGSSEPLNDINDYYDYTMQPENTYEYLDNIYPESPAEQANLTEDKYYDHNGEDDYQDNEVYTKRNGSSPNYDLKYESTVDHNDSSVANYKYNLYSDYLDYLGLTDDNTNAPISNEISEPSDEIDDYYDYIMQQENNKEYLDNWYPDSPADQANFMEDKVYDHIFHGFGSLINSDEVKQGNYDDMISARPSAFESVNKKTQPEYTESTIFAFKEQTTPVPENLKEFDDFYENYLNWKDPDSYAEMSNQATQSVYKSGLTSASPIVQPDDYYDSNYYQVNSNLKQDDLYDSEKDHSSPFLNGTTGKASDDLTDGDHPIFNSDIAVDPNARSEEEKDAYNAIYDHNVGGKTV